MWQLNVIFLVPAARFAVKATVAWVRRRRARVESAKEDLLVLNDQSTMVVPLSVSPPTFTIMQRGGIMPTTELQRHRTRNHKRFCAQWARAAKARFEFARVCEDTALNRAALHRWFLGQWKEMGEKYQWNTHDTRFHKLDLFMTDTIDMALLPTAELVQSESKRAVRKRARMEFYNERKFVEGWK